VRRDERRGRDQRAVDRVRTVAPVTITTKAIISGKAQRILNSGRFTIASWIAIGSENATCMLGPPRTG
jgi:hypothetical protein